MAALETRPPPERTEGQFLELVSSELRSLQAVISEANARIAKLQSEIHTKGGVACGRSSSRSYSLTPRLQQRTPDEPTEDGMRKPLQLQEAFPSSGSQGPEDSPSKQAVRNVSALEVAMKDPDLAGSEEVEAQFVRIDTSMNGLVSAQELTAIAITYGQSVTLKGVINAVNYLNVSIQEKNGEYGCDLHGFQRLRSDAHLEAPPDIAATLVALKKGLEDESHNHVFETSKAMFSQRQRTELLKEAMDIGIVFIIFINAIVIGISIDNPQDRSLWETLELVFFGIYLLECLVKNGVFGVRNYFWGTDWSWNWFDFFCLFISAFELLVRLVSDDVRQGQSPVTLLKVLRLARPFRLVRIMRFKMFKELKLMAMGLLTGFRALAWAIVLLMAVIYVISIVTKSFFGDEHEEFRSVVAGMFTLFRCFTEACETYEGDPIPEKLYQQHGWQFHVSYVVVTMLVPVGIFNLIMAIFIDDVTKSQNQRKQKELGETAIETEVNLKMLLARFINEPSPENKRASQLMDRISEDVVRRLSNLTDVAKKRHKLEQRVCADEAFRLLKECEINISREIFQAWLRNQEFVRVLEEADVDVSNKFELFDILDVDLGGELSPHELLTGLLSLRGDVSKGDVIYILLRVRDMTHRLDQLQQEMQTLAQPR